MRFFRNLAGVVALVWLVLTPKFGSAGEPTAQLSATVNELVTILVNTPVSELRAHGLPDKALQLVYARFDFSELTRQSLGRHWSALNPTEQREFVDALTQKLLVAYGRSVRASGDEKVEFKGEERNGDLANVETKVVSSNGELPIDYRLRFVNGQWKVYDMVIDQVSIVNNYRAQFDRVIAKSSIRDLLQKIKEPAS
jgi:phospholipid transport system substrate-binding protein